MKNMKHAVFLTAFLGMVLFTGCKDLFHPEGPEEWTVTFYAENGSSGSWKKVTVENGDSVGDAMPANPSKSGYTFDGWWTARDGGGTRFIATTTVTADRAVYAKWTANTAAQYTVTFNANGGSPATQTRTVNSGASVGSANMPTEPTRSGYSFGGWWTAQNGGGTQFTATTTVSANRTVYAKWTANTATQYTVTFNADGGSPATQTRTVNSGASVGSANMPTEPAKSGYSFGGWWTQQNGTGTQFESSTTVSADITVYAKWTVTVTFNLDGGTIGGSTSAVTRTVNNGASVGSANMPTEPSRSGYTFGGWYTAQNGAGTQFESSTTVTADITVYAKWTVTVTFNLDGGTIGGSTSAVTRTVNNGASVGSANMPTEPSRSGYTFGGWYTAQNGAGTQFESSTTVSADITVYAKWTLAVPPSDLSLAQSLSWLSTNAIAGGSYTITLKEDETIGPQTLSYDGKNVGVTLTGGSAERWVILNSTGSLFTVESGVTLTLGNNVTLQGRSNNTASLVRVNSGGTLSMNTGAKISGNTSSASYGGGGVFVYTNGTFTMSGGTISGNTASSDGGGVFVYSSGTFTMSGGAISGNTASSEGGGVFVYSSGTFTQSGGAISGNTSFHGGGGVFVVGTFTMSGGAISGNTATDTSHGYGGGVSVSNTGTFIKQSGGTVYGSNASGALKNTAPSDSRGHAAYVYGSPVKKRNTTAGVGITLNSGISGANGGWVDQYQYTVTFDADGGTPATQTRSVDSDGSTGAENMPTEPSKSGAIFSGWWTARNGGGTEFTATTTVTADITVYAKWTPPLGSVQISLRPQDDPPLSNTALFVNESQSFSAGNGYASYQWYWNGAAISGATSADYTLAAYSKTTGIYELAVVVTTTTGRRLSARCRITIKAN